VSSELDDSWANLTFRNITLYTNNFRKRAQVFKMDNFKFQGSSNIVIEDSLIAYNTFEKEGQILYSEISIKDPIILRNL